MSKFAAKLRTTPYLVLVVGAVLFVAGVGTAFAAGQQPQTPARNTSTPVAVVVHWAHVSKTFTIISSSAGGTVVSKSMSNPALVDIGWGTRVPARCVPVANMDTTMGPAGTGNARPGFAATGDAGTSGVIVKTYNDNGANVPQSFYLAVICP